MVQPTFKDENRALQELAKELTVLRRHNLQFKPGDPQDNLLMMAEVALTCMTLEHFVRVVVGDTPEHKRKTPPTLYDLLKIAILDRGLICLTGFETQAKGIEAICKARNALLHGNYAQAARQSGCASVADYFGSVFASELETIFEITNDIMRQIDPKTGKPYRAVSAT